MADGPGYKVAYEPIGVVGMIIPWNSPLMMLTGTLAPCLAIGNTIVVKPSEHATASALALAELVIEAGIPPGVVNVVTGDGVTTGDAERRQLAVRKRGPVEAHAPDLNVRRR